jgi:hypothetical protein
MILKELRFSAETMVESRMVYRNREAAGIAENSKLILEGVCGSVG